jgi:hypothetical protein
LDTINKLDTRIRLLRKGNEAPKDWKRFKTQANVSLYLDLFSANGGQINLHDFDKILISGDMIEGFLRDVAPIMPKTNTGKSTHVFLGYAPSVYKDMTTFRDKFPMFDDPAAFAIQMCMFSLDWIKNMFNLNSVEEAALFMTYLRNSNAKDFGGKLAALMPLVRRLEK